MKRTSPESTRCSRSRQIMAWWFSLIPSRPASGFRRCATMARCRSRLWRVSGQPLQGFDNIIWLNGNDFNTWKTPGDDAVVRAVAEGIKSADPRHLQTIETERRTSSSYDDPTWAPIASVNSTYTYSPTYLQMWHSYNQTPTAPTFLLEAHYDLIDFGKPWITGRRRC